jgi:hypothetical protein
LQDELLICDVVVENPIAPSKLQGHAWRDFFSGDLYDAEERKVKKYTQLARATGAKVEGMAWSVYGGMGKGALRVLGKLCALSQEAYGLSPALFTSSLYDSLAVAVARRVGAIISEGSIRQQHATCRMAFARRRPRQLQQQRVAASSPCRWDEHQQQQQLQQQEGQEEWRFGVVGAHAVVAA